MNIGDNIVVVRGKYGGMTGKILDFQGWTRSKSVSATIQVHKTRRKIISYVSNIATDDFPDPEE